jgi:hypothetical protein
MAEKNGSEPQEALTPHPSLRLLDRLVGTWTLEGRSLDSEEQNVTGTTWFSWLHDAAGVSFFLQQDMEMDYGGELIKSHELIGYNPEIKRFVSYVFSNMAPDPWPYQWSLEGDDLTITIDKNPMDATFTAKFSADGNSFSGGWRPNPGADPTINAPYDVTASRWERGIG